VSACSVSQCVKYVAVCLQLVQCKLQRGVAVFCGVLQCLNAVCRSVFQFVHNLCDANCSAALQCFVVFGNDL